MADWLTKTQRSFNMSAIRSRGNASTEIALARLLRAEKITGWRSHQDLPGKPDFVFRHYRVAVFVDGCFWHGCPTCYRMPEDNRPYWSEKVKRNRERDKRRARELKALGWRVVRIWEHSLKTPRHMAAVIRNLRKAFPSDSSPDLISL